MVLRCALRATVGWPTIHSVWSSYKGSHKTETPSDTTSNGNTTAPNMMKDATNVTPINHHGSGYRMAHVAMPAFTPDAILAVASFATATM